VSRYQKKHSPTHHPDHHPIFISFHLPRFIAYFLFKLRAWQSFCTTSFHVLFGLPLGLGALHLMFHTFLHHYFTTNLLLGLFWRIFKIAQSNGEKAIASSALCTGALSCQKNSLYIWHQTDQCPRPLSPHFSTGRMPFLSSNQQCQSTEGKNCHVYHAVSHHLKGFSRCILIVVWPIISGCSGPCIFSIQRSFTVLTITVRVFTII